MLEDLLAIRKEFFDRKEAESIFLGKLANYNHAPEIRNIAQLLVDKYPGDLIWSLSLWTAAFGILRYDYQPLPLLHTVLLSIIRHPTFQLDLDKIPDPTSHIVAWYEKARDVLKARINDLLEEALINLYYEVRAELLKELNGKIVIISDKEERRRTEQHAADIRRSRLRVKSQGPGRPGRFNSKEQFIHELQNALHIARQREKKITQDAVLPYFSKAIKITDSRKLRDYLTKFGLSWEEAKKL